MCNEKNLAYHSQSNVSTQTAQRNHTLSDPTDLAHVIEPSNSLKILNSKKSKLNDHNPCVQRWDRECSQVSEGRS